MNSRTNLWGIVIVVLLGGAALGQSPPQHTHDWEEYMFPNPPVLLGREYIRCATADVPTMEEITSIGVGSCMDQDHCTQGMPPCSFPGGIANNTVTLWDSGAWSDNGAGGTFGHLDGVGNFVPGPHPYGGITHYRAPEYDPLTGDGPGTVHLSAFLDDNPTAVDPATGNWIYTFDEGPQWTDPTPWENQGGPGAPGSGKLTAYEFTLADIGYNWVPILDDDEPFTATFSPSTDHKQQSMAGTITFNLMDYLNVPGHCMNAQRGSGWASTYSPHLDLKFPYPDPPGFTIQDTMRKCGALLRTRRSVTVSRDTKSTEGL